MIPRLFVFAAAGTTYNLALYLRMASSQRHDSVISTYALWELRSLYAYLRFRYLLGDSAAFDAYALYQHALALDFKPIIDPNKGKSGITQYAGPLSGRSNTLPGNYPTPPVRFVIGVDPGTGTAVDTLFVAGAYLLAVPAPLRTAVPSIATSRPSSGLPSSPLASEGSTKTSLRMRLRVSSRAAWRGLTKTVSDPCHQPGDNAGVPVSCGSSAFSPLVTPGFLVGRLRNFRGLRSCFSLLRCRIRKSAWVSRSMNS